MTGRAALVRNTVWLVVLVTSCAPLPEFPFAAHADLAPPRIVELHFPDPSRLTVTFDEPCSVVEGSIIPGESLATAVTASVSEASLTFLFGKPPDPAREHMVEAQVADQAGNHLRFVARFYGVNALLPALLINEFTTQGSGKHPDLVEIRVLTEGNLAGACLYEGVPGDWEQRFVFPDLHVAAGDYIVVHFKPEGIPEEVDETRTTDESGGYDAHPEAWDFWVPDGSGLSGNNGVITLCENPVGGIIDAVLYSNRTSSSDERYRGFGSTAVMERADALVAAGAWVAEAGTVRPEDAVNPEDSTATRSMSRSRSGADSNSRHDWHITPTRGLTAGYENEDAVYEP